MKSNKPARKHSSTVISQLLDETSEITKWLSGTQNFTIDTLTEIAVAFNMSIGELLAPPSPLLVYKWEMAINIKEPAQSEPYLTTITGKKKSSTYIGDSYLNTILSLSSPNLAKS